MIRLLVLSLLIAVVGGGMAQTPETADIYAPGRAIVADLDRIVTPNGVQETFEAVLGGARQVVNVRGADRGNPILIYIHGGPGAVEMPFGWAFQRPWEDFFTVVQWDQRGAGRSYPLNDPKTLAATLPSIATATTRLNSSSCFARSTGSERYSCSAIAGVR